MILGALKGNAQAGCMGDRNCFIFALDMQPIQIKVLGDQIKDARVSHRLADSPACLVSPDDGVTSSMESSFCMTRIRRSIEEVTPSSGETRQAGLSASRWDTRASLICSPSTLRMVSTSRYVLPADKGLCLCTGIL